MDFTLKIYHNLIEALIWQGFSFQPFADFLKKPEYKVIILRHDVDRLLMNSLEFARIQAKMGIKSTFYFRVVQESWNERIIKQIAELGHEVGYHYEDIGLIAQQHKDIKSEEELVKLAIKSFTMNLEKLRKITLVMTICMHGNPMSKWDSRLLWKYYDYHDFGIIAEPYFDINFNEVLYLTDTGRRWDGDNYNIRDKEYNYKTYEERINNAKRKVTPSPPLLLSSSFHSTFDIIKAAEKGLLPNKIMMTFHPQRWTNQLLPWIKELVWQNTKNIAKYFLIKLRNG
jgi:hypothetical protein